MERDLLVTVNVEDKLCARWCELAQHVICSKHAAAPNVCERARRVQRQLKHLEQRPRQVAHRPLRLHTAREACVLAPLQNRDRCPQSVAHLHALKERKKNGR